MEDFLKKNEGVGTTLKDAFGDVDTHGAYDPEYANEMFIADDKRISENWVRGPGYLGTPSGRGSITPNQLCIDGCLNDSNF